MSFEECTCTVLFSCCMELPIDRDSILDDVTAAYMAYTDPLGALDPSCSN